MRIRPIAQQRPAMAQSDFQDWIDGWTAHMPTAPFSIAGVVTYILQEGVIFTLEGIQNLFNAVKHEA